MKKQHIGITDFYVVYKDNVLAQNMVELESSYLFVNEEEFFRNLVNTSESRDEPFYRWARYREGYSGKLVKELILRSGLDPSKHFVFDPMCGSGSTLIAAAELGFDSLGSDVNPYSVDLTNVKFIQLDSAQINNIYLFLERARIIFYKSDLSKINMDIASKYFKSENLAQLNIIKNHIQAISDNSIGQLLRIAWSAILEDCSERRKDGNGLATRPSPIKDVWARFEQQVTLFLDDIGSSTISPSIKAEAVCQSAFCSEEMIKQFSKKTGKELGSIIFSPPYANSFDYFESYKIELLVGGYYDEAGLAVAREKTIRNYRKGYGYQLETDNKFVELLCKEIKLRIPEKERKTGKIDNRSRLVPNLLVGYFSDMESVIKSFGNAMKSNSTCNIVVDQSSYLGIIIPTDILLAEIASRNGFKIEKLIRCRKANTSGQQAREYPYLKTMLRETIISLRKE